MRWALLPCLSSVLVVSALRGVFLEEKEMAHDMIQSLIFVLCPKKNVCEQVSHCSLAWVCCL